MKRTHVMKRYQYILGFTGVTTLVGAVVETILTGHPLIGALWGATIGLIGGYSIATTADHNARITTDCEAEREAWAADHAKWVAAGKPTMLMDPR